MNPLSSTGMLVHMPRGGEVSFLGTCAAFRQPWVALTAAHCLGELEPSEIVVHYPSEVRASSSVHTRRLVHFERHQKADLAFAYTEPDEDDSFEGYPEHAFWDYVGNLSLGEEFIAYGFQSKGLYPCRPRTDQSPAFSEATTNGISGLTAREATTIGLGS
jgi:hypothetical protein